MVKMKKKTFTKLAYYFEILLQLLRTRTDTLFETACTFGSCAWTSLVVQLSFKGAMHRGEGIPVKSVSYVKRKSERLIDA